MNQQFTQSREFYLELAKTRRNRQWTFICLANVLRILEKEKATVRAAAVSNDFELDWSFTG
jgi:hypothetical protein